MLFAKSNCWAESQIVKIRRQLRPVFPESAEIERSTAADCCSYRHVDTDGGCPNNGGPPDSGSSLRRRRGQISIFEVDGELDAPVRRIGVWEIEI
jgi:hypothetical protein